MKMEHRKRAYVGSIAVMVAFSFVLAGCTAPKTGGAPAGPAASNAADVPAKPSAPVSLDILDAAGNRQLTETMINEFIKKYPDVISSVTWEAAAAPDVNGILKPQIASGSIKNDVAIVGMDALSAGLPDNLWVPLATDYSDRISNMKNYIKPAQAMQDLTQGYGVEVTYYPSGPLLQYDPEAVKDVPKTPEQLLAWAKAHPGKFGYARPANSGPGRTFLMGLPYMLGDSNPKDPVKGWDKTWAYLKELGKYVTTYPTGTGQVISNMADGTWVMIPTTTGWDIQPRADGREPARIKAAAFNKFTWVTDAHYFVVPKGQSADKLSAILLLLQYMLKPSVNVEAYANGYFYPGPAVKGATLDKAPQASQDLIAEFGRDWYDALIEKMPKAVPLAPAELVKAFDIWDRTIGSGKFEVK